MLKLSSSAMKKGMSILLAVLFVVSLTAAASSAKPYHQQDHLGHDHLGEDHDNHNNHNNHDYDDCWAWSPTKEAYVYVC